MFFDHIHSGPILKKVETINIKPNILASTHTGDTLNKLLKNLFSKIALGLNIFVIAVQIKVMHMMIPIS